MDYRVQGSKAVAMGLKESDCPYKSGKEREDWLFGYRMSKRIVDGYLQTLKNEL